MIKNSIIFSLSLFTLVCSSCKKESQDDTSIVNATPNILLIIADDLGRDAIKGYTEGSIKPNTPYIDAIRSKGLTFNNFWSNPVCSPTRSAILTGKYGYRTNVRGASDILSQSETSLQKYINDNSGIKYATAIVGKWHLAGTNSTFNPESMGIDYYSGIIRGAVTDYYNWTLTEDGSAKTQNTYATEALTTTSINWINQQTQPWFMWLAYNAPHTPFHVPPSTVNARLLWHLSLAPENQKLRGRAKQPALTSSAWSLTPRQCLAVFETPCSQHIERIRKILLRRPQV